MAVYLYVISRLDGVRKLGRSGNPQARASQLYREVPREVADSLAVEYQAECPADLIAKAETHAQHLLREWRYQGEWFEVDADTARQAVDAAAAIAAQGGPFPVPKVERMNILVPPEMRAAIREWRFSHYIDTEGEAIRQLLRLALEAHGMKAP